VVNTAFEHRRLEYDVGIGYSDDIDRARGLILETVRGTEGVLAEPAPDVLLMDFAPSSISLRVRWWIAPFAFRPARFG
jgi:small-conductance mechanosensitive channel